MMNALAWGAPYPYSVASFEAARTKETTPPDKNEAPTRPQGFKLSGAAPLMNFQALQLVSKSPIRL